MAWLQRLLNLTRSARHSAELDREIQFHLDERVDALMAQGLSEADARREARRRFGHPGLQKERTRDVDVVVWLEAVVADVRYALRALRLSPGFTFVAVLSIALGVGANTAIFSLINAVMLRSLPVPRAEQLVRVTAEGGETFTNPLWEEIRDHQDAVDVFAWGNASFNLANGGEARRVDGAWVSGSYFPVLGVQPLAGRLPAVSDDRRGCAPIAVVSAGFAAREFGAPASAVGRTVSLDGHPFDVVGVVPPSFFGMDVGQRLQVFAPICASEAAGSPGVLDQRSRWWLQIMGRPREALTAEQASARVAAAAPAVFAATLPPDWPADIQAEYLKYHLAVSPAATGYSSLRDRYQSALVALMVLVGVVLLIACANVAHLLLARAAARQREMALRRALGAGRARLVRQLLTESVLLALLGAALGVGFARWAGGTMVGMLSNRQSAVWLDLGLDLRVLAFTVGVAVLSGILFGLAPSWRATGLAPQASLQAPGRGVSAGPGRASFTRSLVVGQVALSVVLLVAAGLLLRSFRNLVTFDPGFRREGVLLVRMDLQNTGFPDEVRLTLFDDILQRLRALPGVRSASASVITPIQGARWNGDIIADGFVPKGERDGIVWYNGVSPDFFTTMDTRQVAGRDFTRSDVRGGPLVAVVNESLARKVFGNANPIGRMFRTRNGRGLSAPTEIVGVVRDARYASLTNDNVATVYLPLAQTELWGQSLNFELRTDGDPALLVGPVRDLAGAVNHAISLDFVTLADQVAASLARPRLLALLSGFFGSLAVLLATVGLYGTVAYSVARRRNEIGIRIALGADRGRVVRMVLAEVGRIGAAGVALGIALSLAVTRLLATFLFDLSATDPVTLGLAATVLGAGALVAGTLPAWRAARLDPMVTLRED